MIYTIPKLTVRPKIRHPKRKPVFQPSIFRCENVSFRLGIIGIFHVPSCQVPVRDSPVCNPEFSHHALRPARHRSARVGSLASKNLPKTPTFWRKKKLLVKNGTLTVLPWPYYNHNPLFLIGWVGDVGGNIIPQTTANNLRFAWIS